MNLFVGKTYYWNLGTPRNGMFTGSYNENGNAIFLDKNGIEWAVPEELIQKNPYGWSTTSK